MRPPIMPVSVCTHVCTYGGGALGDSTACHVIWTVECSTTDAGRPLLLQGVK